MSLVTEQAEQVGQAERRSPVRYEVAEGFATVTLDSPENRNAISERLLADLRSALQSAAQDAEVRAVVLAHTGNTFCAGADLAVAERETRTPAEISDHTTRAMAALLREMLELPKPIVACIDGHVRAGGMGILAACDLAIAGRTSTFALTEARLGVAPAIISLTLLPRLTGRAASRYFLTGERFEADRAEQIGLITAAADDPRELTHSMLAEFAKASPQGLAESKRLTTHEILTDFDVRADELAKLSARLFTSAEAAEGIMAFLERRHPAWAVAP